VEDLEVQRSLELDKFRRLRDHLTAAEGEERATEAAAVEARSSVNAEDVKRLEVLRRVNR